MKKTAYVLTALIVLAALCLFAACAPDTGGTDQAAGSAQADGSAEGGPAGGGAEAETDESASSGPQWPLTVTDLEGTEVTIESAERIVSVTPSTTDILVTEGAQDRIVGIDSYSQKVPGAEICGDFTAPDVEKIVALEPDVVFTGGSIQRDAVAQMRSLGLAVVCAEATSWEQVPESFTLIGQITGETGNADILVQELNDAVQQAEELRPDESPTCYYVLSFGDAGNWTSGPGSFINTMIELAGGTCVTGDAPVAWPEYSIEEVVAANPQCFLLSSAAGSYSEFVQSPGYADLEAVKDGRVYEIDADSISQPGPNLAEALLSVSSIVQTAAEDLAAVGEAA